MLAEEREGIAFQHIAEAVADLVFVMSAFTSSQCSTGSAWLAILMAGMAVPIRCESGSKQGSGKYSSQGDDRTAQSDRSSRSGRSVSMARRPRYSAASQTNQNPIKEYVLQTRQAVPLHRACAYWPHCRFQLK